MTTPKFSDLSEDGRLAVFQASLGLIGPGSLDLLLLPQEEVLMQIMRHQNTCLGENFKSYLLATLSGVAEEVIANMETCIAQGYPDQATRVNKRRDQRIRPRGIFTLVDDKLRDAYGIKAEKWELLKLQVDGFAPHNAEHLEKSALFEERNCRWFAAWLAIERAGERKPREGKKSIEDWLRDAADPSNEHGLYKKLYAPRAQEILGEHSCPRCGQSVSESLVDEVGWDCCQSCHDDLDQKGSGWDWCSTCCVDTNWSDDVTCQCL